MDQKEEVFKIQYRWQKWKIKNQIPQNIEENNIIKDNFDNKFFL